jgi:hypothetical protein
MKIDASGIKELEGKIIKVAGALTIEIEIEDLEIENPDKVKGIEEGNPIEIWLACLRVPKGGKFEEPKEFLENEVLGKMVMVRPDPMNPNKQRKNKWSRLFD